MSEKPILGGSQGHPRSAFGVKAHRPRSLHHKPPKSPTASALTRDNASGIPSLAIGSTNASVGEGSLHGGLQGLIRSRYLMSVVESLNSD